MELRLGKIRINGGAALIVGSAVFFCGYAFAAALILAAAVHEAGHYFAVRAQGGEVTGITFGTGGARMDYRCRTGYGGDMLTALAGPLCSVLFAAVCAAMGKCSDENFLFLTAGMSFVFGVFNLLPISVLDGGTAMKAAICAMGKTLWAERLCGAVDFAVCGMLTVFGVFAAFRGNFTAIICAVSVIGECCKKQGYGVKF